MNIDLTQIPTPELLEIKKILQYGARTYASRAENAELKHLRKENAQLRKIEQRRSILADIGIDIEEDRPYWLSLSDATFNFVVGKMADIRKEVAIAEATRSIKIPNLVAEPELSAYEQVRQGLAERKRNNGRKEIE